eukprot:TRINITY_DN622_c0_g1_i4.p1 TRINITY_DN622_c0_g1~~TRINITY_DN622_c0_g1_i4.p1  ORF type:complete len:195 (+),score=46.40 TRINITY_DN622_c0_g1_i4:908-1492(+)
MMRRMARIDEVKRLKEENSKLQKISGQRDDLDYRVRKAEERILQQSREEQELTNLLGDMIKKNYTASLSPLSPSNKSTERCKNRQAKQVEKLNDLLQEVSELRKHCHGGNVAVEFEWYEDLESPVVYVCGNFPEEDFSIPHVLTKIDVTGKPRFWKLQMHLPPGTFHYRFNVNGEWKINPNVSCEGDRNILVVK